MSDQSIVVFIEPDKHYRRLIMGGILRFARKQRPWTVRIAYPTPDPRDEVSRLDWKPSGALVCANSRIVSEMLHERGIPHIAIAPHGSVGDLAPVVELDREAVGRLAATHLTTLGLRHLVFVGAGGRPSREVDSRYTGFERGAMDAGGSCLRYCVVAEEKGGWEAQESAQAAALGRFLKAQPRPLGVFAYNDHFSRLVLRACGTVGLQVPHDVAILGVDDDPVLAEGAYPTLSSIQWPGFSIGFQAAWALERLLDGGTVPPLTQIPPTDVTVRQSTRLSRVTDAIVARAIDFIHGRAGQGLGVGDVVDGSGISRRSLEQRFRRAVGCTIHDAIIRARLERAQQLLVETALALPLVAEAAGFAGLAAFYRAFRERCGTTPAAYRRAGAGAGVGQSVSASG